MYSFSKNKPLLVQTRTILFTKAMFLTCGKRTVSKITGLGKHNNIVTKENRK